jgi:ankyrin repeat protein/catechol 2,3-dioxygenase-like lactoylglutathione lyase family enzyme
MRTPGIPEGRVFMSASDLPERASLEYLKKLAKERLRELRQTDPAARLSDAQLAVARDHGFRSWRALKAEVDRRSSSLVESFFAACAAGDLSALRALLDEHPGLVRERVGGGTGLHAAVRHPDAVRLLLEYGADPNARDLGDNALPLHFAAGGAPLEAVEALLDAGSDVQGTGDAHRLDVIGWATCFGEARGDVADLLVKRGARHHIFSAIALGDVALLRRVVEGDRDALNRRLSRSEQEQTALHYVVAPPDGLVGGMFRRGGHYDTLDVLIELGADLEARDSQGRTPMQVAMLRGDQEAMRRLHQAGARAPVPAENGPPGTPSDFRSSVEKLTPMLGVPDVRATVSWYRSIGFELVASHGEEGGMDWALVAFGKAEIMFSPSTDPWRQPTTGLSVWIRTNRIDDLYASLKRQQFEAANATLTGRAPDAPQARFTVDLYTTFYGQREFGIRDPNGVELMFAQELEEGDAT